MLEPDEYKRVWTTGVRQAEADIHAGEPKLFWGCYSSFAEFMKSLFAERFGVAVIGISDITTQERSVKEFAYNLTIEQMIDTKHGEGSFQAAMDEVTDYRAKTHEAFLAKKQSKDSS